MKMGLGQYDIIYIYTDLAIHAICNNNNENKIYVGGTRETPDLMAWFSGIIY